MKKPFTIIILVFIVTNSIAQSNNGLIAHWNFNNNVLNATGNNSFNGTPYNITYSQGLSGQSNSAAVFNGTNSYITVAYQNPLNISQYTICAVVKINGFYSGQCEGNYIISRGGWPNAGGWGLNLNDNPFNSCGVYDTSKFVFTAFAGNANPASITDWQYTPTARTNTWYNIVATYNGSVYKIYVDGNLVNTVNTASGSIGSSSRNLSIGKDIYSAQYPYWFNGLIDDLRVYNRVLADSEIVAYNYSLLINQPYVDTVLCTGKTFTVNYSTTTNYNVGNTFTVQLSDANGSFSAPVNIGSVIAQGSGTITCTVPITTPAGNSYRIRIHSSSPQKTSDDNGIDIQIGTKTTLTANIVPNPGNIVGPFTPVTFTANLTNGGINPKYQWVKNGINIGGANAATYVAVSNIDFFANDKYTVFVTSDYPCLVADTITSSAVTMNINLNTKNLSYNNYLQALPNPSNGTFTLYGNISPKNKIRIQITNMFGKIVYNKYIKINDRILNQKIQLPNISPGVYQLRLISDTGIKTLMLNIQ